MEIARRGNADRRAVMPTAPSDVIRAIDFAEPRIVGVIGSRRRIALFKLDRFRLDLPIDAIIAPTHVEMWEPRALFQTEDTHKAIAVRRHRAVVHSLNAGHVMPADDGVRFIPPDDVAAA